MMKPGSHDSQQHRRSPWLNLRMVVVALLAFGSLPQLSQLAYGESLGADVTELPALDAVDAELLMTEPSDGMPEAGGDESDPAQAQPEGDGEAGPIQVMPQDEVMPMAIDLPSICTIASTADSSRCLDIPGGSTSNSVQAQLWSANVTPAQRFQLTLNPDNSYTIRNVNSGLVLDICGARLFNGAVVWQYASHGGDNQKWYITNEGNGYRIASKQDPRYCLDVPGGVAVNGARMQVWESNGLKAQRFLINPITPIVPDGAYIIKSAASARVMDILGESSADGTIAQHYDNIGNLAQRFLLTFDARTGYYEIRNVQSNKVLDVSGGSTQNGARVQIYTPLYNNCQRWALTAASNGCIRISAAHSGKSLGAPTGPINNFTPIQTFDWASTSSQEWSFIASTTVNTGTYEMHSNLGTVLDAQGNGQVNGTNIWAYAANGASCQKFYLTSAGNGFFKLECLNSGLFVTAQGTNVVLYQEQNSNAQLWQLQPAGEGRFHIANRETGKVLDILGANARSGVDVIVYAKNTSQGQLWRFVRTYAAPDALYTVKSALNTSYVLDIRDNSSANGAKLQLLRANGSQGQVFQFTAVGYPYYHINCLNSGKALDISGGVLVPKGIAQLWTAYPGTTNRYQLWRVDYIGGGNFKIYSAIGDSNYCLTVEGGAAVDRAEVNAYPSTNSASQNFKLGYLGNTTYVTMNITLDQMVRYQRDNSYINNITDQQLYDVINPSSAMSDYSFPSHSRYTHGEMQFADLRMFTGMNAAQMDSIINSYAPANSMLRGKGYVFVDAARSENINEAYLLAHCALESGWGTSELARGYVYDGRTLVDGRTWPAGTYYNFFGIGAVDSGPLSGGRAYAIKNGWNTVDKAIAGGARWIVEGYIYRDVYYPPYSQSTLYSMKWDNMRSSATSAYGWHQYATDHLWARKIARLMGDFYDQVGVRPSLVYIIPQYR